MLQPPSTAVALGLRAVPGVAFALRCLAVGIGVLFPAWVVRYRIGTPLVVLGRQTLPIYLMHMLFLAVLMATLLSPLVHRLLPAAGATWLFAPAVPARPGHEAGRAGG